MNDEQGGGVHRSYFIVHRSMTRNKTDWITPALALAAFAAISWAEWRWPLRPRVEPRKRHLARNLTFAALTALIESVVQRPLSEAAFRKRGGLLRRLRLRPWSHSLATILLLDYTLWWWHWASHECPPLWRFHLVHHVDRDLDASTALRFHFGEMTLAALFRAGQIALLGADRRGVTLWQRMLMVSIIFQHSNLRLPLELEGGLVRVLVTPRMHGIHHGDIRELTSSNWSSFLSWWDMLHGTFRFDVPQEAITIGVPAWHDPGELTLPKILAMPFRAQREDWV
jgi:sterol desaturase/sphingolipid hydroxylase (fatty acid hydroxylase superfamily)